MLSPLGGWLRSIGRWNPPARIRPARWPPGVIGLNDIDRGRILNAATRSSGGRAAADRRGRPVPAAPGCPGPVPARSPTSAASPRIWCPYRRGYLDPNISAAVQLYDLDEDTRLDLSQWTHVAAQGRDHYVRLVYEGKLSDLGHPRLAGEGHRAPLRGSPTGAPVAYLRQYMYVVVRSRRRTTPNEGLAHDGRAMPLSDGSGSPRSSRPHIDYPLRTGPPSITDRSFWVMVGGQDFLFHGIAEDVAGNVFDFAKPLIFVPEQRDRSSRPSHTRSRLRQPKPGCRRGPRPEGDASPNPTRPTRQGQHLVRHRVVHARRTRAATRDTFFKPASSRPTCTFPRSRRSPARARRRRSGCAQTFVDQGFGDAANRTGTFAEVVTSPRPPVRTARSRV